MKTRNSHQANFLHLLDYYIQEDLAIAFSGGVDSTLLVASAHDLCKKKKHNLYAVTFQTSLHPLKDLEITEKLAKDFGISHYIIQVDELASAGIENNPVERCFLCKRYLMSRLKSFAVERSVSLLMDGTNADDMQLSRPGLRALKELQIVSPLAEAGMTKSDIRSLAAEYGISVANRPSTPCLATRFPYNTQLSRAEMQMVGDGEEFMRSFGFYNVRLRVHGDIARIEVDSKDLSLLLQYRERIVGFLKALGFTYVTADLEGFYSGSMDRKLAEAPIVDGL